MFCLLNQTMKQFLIDLEKDYSGKTEHKDSDKSKKRIVWAGTIHSRDGDGNTPINSTENTVLSEKLWRRHFGFDRAPLQRVTLLLARPSDWKITINTLEGNDASFQSCYYHEVFRNLRIFGNLLIVRENVEDWIIICAQHHFLKARNGVVVEFSLSSDFIIWDTWCFFWPSVYSITKNGVHT